MQTRKSPVKHWDCHLEVPTQNKPPPSNHVRKDNWLVLLRHFFQCPMGVPTVTNSGRTKDPQYLPKHASILHALRCVCNRAKQMLHHQWMTTQAWDSTHVLSLLNAVYPTIARFIPGAFSSSPTCPSAGRVQLRKKTNKIREGKRSPNPLCGTSGLPIFLVRK